MTPDEIAHIGQALHGERWQTALARDLGVSARTVRHWLSGRNRPPATLRIDLLELMDRREVEIDRRRRELAGS